MCMRKDEINRRNELIKEAKRLFPEHEEIQEAIRTDNGNEVVRLVNEARGAGYCPNPSDIVELCNKGRVHIIRAQAQNAVDQQNFYSRCVEIYASA